MRLLYLFLIITAAAYAAPGTGTNAIPAYSFEENRGQFDSDVRYTARGRDYQLFLTPREAVLSLHSHGKPASVLRLRLRGSRVSRAMEAMDAVETRSHYLVGGRESWRQEVPHWGRVRYREVYPGIDLIYYGRDGELEYDFVVAPGRSPSQIAMEMKGADAIEMTETGSLRLRLKSGELLQRAPVAYQETAGGRRPVEVHYELKGDGGVGFHLGEYDRTLPLVIDPLLIYSTYLGGDRTDEITCVAVDKDGNTYLAGETTSNEFPTVNPFLPKPSASVHAFVTKINAAGDRILYSSYLGGDGNTHADAIAVDGDGNVYVAGRTGARNFPLVNPVQQKQTGLNIVFVSKLNAQGSQLLFSTYLGGERNDEPYGIALDDAGDIFVVGISNSTQFPTVNAMAAKPPGGGDGFIAKFAAPGYNLAYSTFFGGTGNDEIHGLAVDGAGNAFVTGSTTSANLGSKNAFQPQLKSQDAFVAKMTADGSGMEFFTYLGGTGYERGRAIKLGLDGTIWVGGYTTSGNFPVTSGGFQQKLNGDSDAFVSHLSADGQQLLYSTFLGGTKSAGFGGEDTAAIAIDSDGSVLAAGVTMSPDFPTVRKTQDFGGGKQDSFLVKFAPEGERVVFATFLGGSGDEIAEALAVDGGGGIYVGGQTASADYPVKGGVRSQLAGSNEGFLTKVCDPFLWTSQAAPTFVQVLGRPAPEAQTFLLVTCAPIPFTATIADGRFLTVSAGDTKTTTEVKLKVDAGSLALGEYHDEIRFSAPDAVNDGLVIPVTLIVKLPPPAISVEGVVDAGSGEASSLTAGMAIEIRGTDLGPKTPVALADGAEGMELAGTVVTFDDIPGKVIFTSDKTVRVVVPDGVTGKSDTVVAVLFQGQVSNAVKLPVTQIAAQ